jgi:hypothetical protein
MPKEDFKKAVEKELTGAQRTRFREESEDRVPRLD